MASVAVETSELGVDEELKPLAVKGKWRTLLTDRCVITTTVLYGVVGGA